MLATNLIGRVGSYFDKNKPSQTDKEGTNYIGVVCAVFDQVDPRIAPRVALEMTNGSIVTAPLDSVWMLEGPDGHDTLLGAEMKASAEAIKAKAAKEARHGRASQSSA